MKKIAALLVFAGVVTVGGVAARAGHRYLYDRVDIDEAGRRAYGQMGASRNTGDDVQYIGCYVFQDGDYSMGTLCQARTKEGVARSCYFYGSNTEYLGMHDGERPWEKFGSINLVALAINGDSYLSFEWYESGVCKNLRVENMSWHAPKSL